MKTLSEELFKMDGGITTYHPKKTPKRNTEQEEIINDRCIYDTKYICYTQEKCPHKNIEACGHIKEIKSISV